MKNRITITLIGLLAVISSLLLLFKTNNKVSIDAIKFKEEYESLNDTVRKSDGKTYNNIKISKKNPIKYINASEAIEVLKKDDAVIYIGANWCPWCRNAIPVLFDVAKKYDVKTIYYLNLDEIKSEFKIEDGKLIKTKDGSKEYYQLLDLLKDHLEDYILTDNSGKSYDTLEKRIYIPLVLGIKHKSVVKTHLGTVKLNENQTKYDALTKEQEKELFQRYDDLFLEVYGTN